MNLQVKWLLGCFKPVCGAGLWSELTTNSLRKKSTWICLSTSFSLQCINPLALVCTVSWNQWKYSQTWVWTSQVIAHIKQQTFCSSLMERKMTAKKSSGISLACLLRFKRYFGWSILNLFWAVPLEGHSVLCVYSRKKTLVLWDICALGIRGMITSRFAPASWKEGHIAYFEQERQLRNASHDGIIPCFDVNLFEWAKFTVFNIWDCMRHAWPG